ncbi:MAG: AAA family ATPase [Magnetococcales bacterium]|nr:AAA family ATPase [Magnetococcales bacterium]
MYESHFGLRESPFSLTPDTGFFFNTPSIKEALDVILSALARGEPIIKVVGASGSGKSLLCRNLLDTLEVGYAFATLLNSQQLVDGLSRSLVDAFGLDHREGMSFASLMQSILEKCASIGLGPRKILVLVDKAQDLTEATLDALELMTHLKMDQEPIVQLVLFGQLGLDESFNRDMAESTEELACRVESQEVAVGLGEGSFGLPVHPKSGALLSRSQAVSRLNRQISTVCRLRAFTRKEMADYVKHRMSRAGAKQASVFSPAALERIYQASGGYPRTINILCHKGLIQAFLARECYVAEDHIHWAIAFNQNVEAGINQKQGRPGNPLISWLKRWRNPLERSNHRIATRDH